MELSDSEIWVLDKIKSGAPVYIESRSLICSFTKEFLPDNIKTDSLGFRSIISVNRSKKVLQKALRGLKDKGFIYKKSLGVFGSKTDLLMGRNWVWCWLLVTAE